MQIKMSRFSLVSGLFIIGAATGAVRDLSLAFALTLIVCVVCILCLARYIVDTKDRTGAMTIGLSFLAGFFLQQTQPNQSTEHLPQACHRIVEGIVERPPADTQKHTRLTLRMIAVSPCLCNKASMPLEAHDGILYATVARTHQFFVNQGHRVRFSAHIQPGRRHFKSLKPSAKARPFYTAYITDPSTVAVLNRSATPMNTWLQKHRKKVQQLFRKNMKRSAAALAIALTTGQRDLLSPKQRQRFRDTGTAHLTVVSGLHLSILALLTYQLSLMILRRVPLVASQINSHCICSVITVPAIWFFALFSGANPPVVRAAIMVSAVLLSRLLYRQTSGAQSLLAAATFLLAHNPNLVVSAGFQLSFASVAGFIVFQKKRSFEAAAADFTSHPAQDDNTGKRIFFAMRNYLGKMLWISFVAFGVTTPFLAWHFHSAPLISPVANLVFVPLVSGVLLPVLVVATLFASAQLPLANLVMHTAGTLIELLEKIAIFFARFAPVVTTADLPDQLLAIAASAGLMSMLMRRFRMGAIFFILCMLGILISTMLSMGARNSELLTLDFLDVGQGDATVITFPTGEHWLIDAGGTAAQSIGQDHIVPILKQLNIRKINKLILTHPDPDHVAGIPDVLRSIPVGEIWENKQGLEEPSPDAYREMHRLAQAKKIRVSSGKSLCRSTRINATSVEVIHPCSNTDTYFPSLSFNDNSIVLSIFHGNHSILLPGDLSDEGEKQLLSQQALPRFNLLKLGHHGSASSTTEAFIRQIRPQYAVASCGFHNRYGFPSATIQKRLFNHGIRLFSTDIHGWIRFEIGLKRIKIVTQKAFL